MAHWLFLPYESAGVLLFIRVKLSLQCGMMPSIHLYFYRQIIVYQNLVRQTSEANATKMVSTITKEKNNLITILRWIFQFFEILFKYEILKSKFYMQNNEI